MQNLLKVYIILLIFSFANSISLEAKLNMGLMTSSNYVGDREVAWRIKIAAERLGWKVYLDENFGQKVAKRKLDLVICLLPENQFFNPFCPNYLMVFHPFNYLDEQRRFKPFYEKYDGYLLTINDRESLQNSLELKNKEFHHIPFYPTLYSIPFEELSYNNLMVMIPVWGNRLNDPKFKKLYKFLDDSGFAKFYGLLQNKDLVPQSYMGAIPFDGISVINILQQHGIVLVFHSEIHNAECIPSSRIFEAAAASTVIISDENPFVKKHFGDSVFYIDTSKSAKSIFYQIQKHMQTILEDPERAREMAKNAHQIFIDNFTMENQLLQLEELHQKVMSKRRNK